LVEAYLVAVAGPSAPFTFPLKQGATVIGQGENCDVVVVDRYVSRRHCLVELGPSEAVIRDLGSKNGTLLNGLPISERQLQPSDRITIGTTELIFSQGAAAEKVSFLEDQTTAIRPDLRPVDRWSAAGPPPAERFVPVAAARDARAVLDCYRLAQLIHSARTLIELADHLCEHVLAMAQGDWAAFFLCDEAGEFRLSTSKCREGLRREQMHFSRTVLREAVSKRTAVLSRELMSDVRFSASESVAEGAFRSVLCVPLLTEDEALGAVYLASRSKTFAFSEAELAWLQAVSGQASVALERMLEREQLLRENAELRRQMVLEHGLIGESPAMKELFRFISRVAPTESAVLIKGETGTGKELVSRAIHYNSRRKDKPFVCINCAALPKDLFESELFGHEKGAFTGAVRAKPGKFELAAGGTVFLDEVGEVALAAQAKLLRVLEGQPFERVGGTAPIQVDVRVLAATNRDLARAVEEGTFRADLYHRLNVIAIELPPLRDRGRDVELLSEFFLVRLREKLAGGAEDFSPGALAAMKRYRWPGNVRELRNAIEHALVLGSSQSIQVEDLPASVTGRAARMAAGAGATADSTALREAERQHILAVYERCGSNKKRAAELLGISRDTLHRKLREYGVR
jgi:transcriptional regulator with GAF, ATPase, and Fis domain